MVIFYSLVFLFIFYLVWSLKRLQFISSKHRDLFLRERNRFIFSSAFFIFGLIFIFFRESEREKIKNMISENEIYSSCIRNAVDQREKCMQNSQKVHCIDDFLRLINGCQK